MTIHLAAIAADAWNREALVELAAGDGRPLLFTQATIVTFDELIGDVVGDVLVVGDLVVGVGPGIVTAAEDDDAIVVDASGMTIFPAAVDASTLAGHPRSRRDGPSSLAPGSAADLLIVPTAASPDVLAALRLVVDRPDQVAAVLRAGVPTWWRGAELTDAVDGGAASHGSADAPRSRVGAWVDTTGFLVQELTEDGRYDETRGGRPHAFQGRYWIDGDRIDYLDDLGFYAFGQFDGDQLHHAGYTMTTEAGHA
jgi:hypothetical protein